ncbi:MAG: hemerythrin domain-containing protein [Rubrivivax sp.]
MAAKPDNNPATTPVDDFSTCHIGILTQLDELGSLPALLEPAARARSVATRTLKFFRSAVHEHHAEEEAELFPAVLASAAKGEERDRVQSMVLHLAAEHRAIEAAWANIEPALKAIGKGQDVELDGAAVARLVAAYRAHAQDEEARFLPLAKSILGRDANHMAALGMSLHLRHALPEVLARFRSRI